MASTPFTVNEYADALPGQAREILAEVRRYIADIVSGVAESIRYQMPVFGFDGMYLIYAGAWKEHLGPYPIPAMAP